MHVLIEVRIPHMCQCPCRWCHCPCRWCQCLSLTQPDTEKCFWHPRPVDLGFFGRFFLFLLFGVTGLTTVNWIRHPVMKIAFFNACANRSSHTTYTQMDYFLWKHSNQAPKLTIFHFERETLFWKILRPKTFWLGFLAPVRKNTFSGAWYEKVVFVLRLWPWVRKMLFRTCLLHRKTCFTNYWDEKRHAFTVHLLD